MKAEKLQNVICDIVSEMPIDDFGALSSKSTKATKRKQS